MQNIKSEEANRKRIENDLIAVEKALKPKLLRLCQKLRGQIADPACEIDDYLQEARLAIYNSLLTFDSAKNQNQVNYCLRGITLHFSNLRRTALNKKLKEQALPFDLSYPDPYDD